MIDSGNLFQTLRTNGINETTPSAQVTAALAALRFNPDDQQAALAILKSNGWMPDLQIQKPAPAATVQPQAAPASFQPHVQMPQAAAYMPQAPVAPRRRAGMLIAVIIVAIVLAGGGALAYAYRYQLPFIKSAFIVGDYKEESFMSSLLAKAGTIDSASYKASASLDVSDREAGAEPFAYTMSNEAELKAQYKNDYKRINDIRAILPALKYAYDPNYSYSYSKTMKKMPASYPSSFAQFASNSTAKSYLYGSISLKDPVTGNYYGYQATDGGTNFQLTVTFQTLGAIEAIRKYNYSATSTPVSGKTVTFTKDSPTFFYMSDVPPQPWIVQLGDLMRQMPPDVRASIGVGATTELKGDTLPDWSFNFDAQGDFGDLSYKVDADALKKDSDYYFRINNMPSIFLGSLSSLKGKWVKVTAQATSSKNSYDPYGGLLSLGNKFPQYEKDYKQNRQQLENFLAKAASVADSVQLIQYKDSPRPETVDGASLTRYDISLRKEAILPFYQKLIDEVNKDPSLKPYYNDLYDPGTVEYLQSDEFNQVFDYLDKNTSFTFWVDAQGYPAVIQEKLRIVPPDTATQLKGKQVNLTFKIQFSGINKPVRIDAPSSYVKLEDAITDFKKNLNYRL